MECTAVIVGPGRLGRTVAHVLRSAGWEISVIGRGAQIPRAPLTWLTVPDREIAHAAAATPAGGVVLHASGATDISPLRPHHPAGSLHPLMTFPTGGQPPPPPIPAAIAGDPEAIQAAQKLATALKWDAVVVSGDRALYHAAAVMAGNYATTLLGLAAESLTAAGVDPARAPKLLAPLALQSLRNAAELGPTQALTGPAVRGDRDVIEQHLIALRALNNTLPDVYESLLQATLRLLDSKD